MLFLLDLLLKLKFVNGRAREEICCFSHGFLYKLKHYLTSHGTRRTVFEEILLETLNIGFILGESTLELLVAKLPFHKTIGLSQEDLARLEGLSLILFLDLLIEGLHLVGQFLSVLFGNSTDSFL